MRTSPSDVGFEVNGCTRAAGLFLLHAAWLLYRKAPGRGLLGIEGGNIGHIPFECCAVQTAAGDAFVADLERSSDHGFLAAHEAFNGFLKGIDLTLQFFGHAAKLHEFLYLSDDVVAGSAHNESPFGSWDGRAEMSWRLPTGV